MLYLLLFWWGEGVEGAARQVFSSSSIFPVIKQTPSSVIGHRLLIK